MALIMKKRERGFIKIQLSLNSPRLERCMVLGNTARKRSLWGQEFNMQKPPHFKEEYQIGNVAA